MIWLIAHQAASDARAGSRLVSVARGPYCAIVTEGLDG